MDKIHCVFEEVLKKLFFPCFDCVRSATRRESYL